MRQTCNCNYNEKNQSEQSCTSDITSTRHNIKQNNSMIWKELVIVYLELEIRLYDHVQKLSGEERKQVLNLNDLLVDFENKLLEGRKLYPRMEKLNN